MPIYYEGVRQRLLRGERMPGRSTSDFIVILPKSVILIPQDHPLSWLTLFYALPKELVEKRSAYLKLPRNIHQVFESDEYTGKNINKRDFMRFWAHSRAAQSVSLEAIAKSDASVDGDTLYDIPDPRSAFENDVISDLQIDQFKGKLTDTDRQILQMRYEGHSLQEIIVSNFRGAYHFPAGIRKTIRYRSQEHRHLNTERNAQNIIKIIGRFFLQMVEYVALF